MRHRTDIRTGGERSSRETGSAYIIALMVLVVLTISGLSLALVTQTELQVGANERTIQRTFYAADSGIDITTAQALVRGDYRAKEYDLTDHGFYAHSLAASTLQRVDVSPLFILLDAPCNLCEINNRGVAYRDDSYSLANYAVTSRATRLVGVNETPLAQRALTAMMQFEPWRPGTGSYIVTEDPEARDEIYF